MEFVAKIRSKPYKIEPIFVPNEYETLENGDIKVIETSKRAIFLSRAEAIKAKESILERIKFHNFEISPEYAKIIQLDIDTLKQMRDSWNEFLFKEAKK